MRKAPKEISGVSSSSIVGLKALLAQEKAARIGKPTSTPAPRNTPVSNKGVSERAQKDDQPQTASTSTKDTIRVHGVGTFHKASMKDDLVDVERKSWEEYERREFMARSKRDSFFEESRKEDELEAQKRMEHRAIIADLEQDTAKGREEHRKTMAKRAHEKMARLELIRAKAAKSLIYSNKTCSELTDQPQEPATTELSPEHLSEESSSLEPPEKRLKLGEVE